MLSVDALLAKSRFVKAAKVRAQAVALRQTEDTREAVAHAKNGAAASAFTC